jgi:hydroxymethylpyrimidine pyrophosphatase-like HAD family hydrolase
MFFAPQLLELRLAGNGTSRMRYHILATDYDGTIATDGALDPPTVEALRKALATGRRLILVTGRELPDLKQVCPYLELFEIVVAENGALLYQPSNQSTTALAEPPPQAFVAELERRGVAPLSVGAAIVATWEPHSQTVLDTIRDLGLELQVIFNKGAVMVLPAGVNKATGLTAALQALRFSPRNVVGVGDAENDHSFLKLCELSAAVANALPSVKDAVDVVTTADHGAGVVELVAQLVADDFAASRIRPERRRLAFGTSEDGEVALDSHGGCVLICGASASGKSTVAKRILESIGNCGYQFCLVDPEGDYEEMENAVAIGNPDAPPTIDEAVQLLEDVGVNGVIGLTGTPISDRPLFFVELFSKLLQLRARYGRPHWLVLDEVHHLMPAEWEPPNGLLPEKLESVLLITVHPELLSREVLKRVTHVIGVGATAPDVLSRIAEARGLEIPSAAPPEKPGEALLWSEHDGRVRLVQTLRPAVEHRRHSRKYAEGNLSPDRSFYFRGEQGKLNLRARNLIQFLELADGVDDDTWEYHFRLGHVSRWFRDAIKDDELADETEELERSRDAAKAESLPLVRTAIERRYTLPAAAPVPVAGAH